MRTLSELTTELADAGYDASKIQQRAEMIAKIQGAKRKRDEVDDNDVDMDDSDEEEGGEDGTEGWMDVDDDRGSPKKKVKTNSGGVVNKKEPKSNRQLAGLRDEEVNIPVSPDSLKC